MVPIRDPKLIGKKIDCPKCKYRFVVEEPAEEEDQLDEEESAPKSKKPAGKSKPGKGRRPDAEEDGEQGAGKKAGMSTTMILGLGLAFVGVVVLGVVGFMVLGGSDEKKSSDNASSGRSGTSPSTPSTPSSTDPSAAKTEEQPKPVVTDVGEITNLLPNDTQRVYSLNVDRFRASTIGQSTFTMPGGFRAQVFKEKLGIALEDISRFLHAQCLRDGWCFNVVRTSKPVNAEELRKLIGVDPKTKKTIKGRDYFTVSGHELLEAFKTSTGPMAIYFHDDRTIVFSDVAPMEKFLDDNASPKPLSDVAPPPADNTAGPGGPGMMPPGGPGMMPPGGGKGGMPMPPGGGGPGGPGGGRGGMPMGPGGGSGGPPQGMTPPGGPGGGSMMPPGRGGMAPPGMGPPGSEQPPVAEPSTAYRTIQPDLKALMDEVEASSDPNQKPIFSAVGYWDDALAKSLLAAGGELTFSQQLGALAAFNTYAVAIHHFGLDKAQGVLALETKQEQVAVVLQLGLRQLAAVLKVLLAPEGVDLAVDMDQQQQGPGGFMGPGMGPGGGMGPPGGGSGMGPRGGMMGPRGGGMMGPRGGMGGPPEGGGLRPPGGGAIGPGGGGGMPNNPSFPGGPGVGGEQPQATKPNSSLFVEKKDRLVIIRAEVQMNPKIHDQLMILIQQLALYLKGRADMAISTPTRIHELAAAVRAYNADVNNTKQQFPRGTFNRPSNAQRAGLPWSPGQRIGWMVELLPYLGHPDMFRRENGVPQGRLDLNKGWHDEPLNIVMARVTIPQFLDPTYPESTRTMNALSMKIPFLGAPYEASVAATHFVGIAGVGLDAADYMANDVNVAGRLGIFGYDRVTKFSDVKDGLANTIMIIQVPADYKAAWMAGGGSTIRGVPETDSVRPFVCTTYNGKKGTFAIMANADVRFIPETISDANFKALCTIAGGEKIDNIDAIAPLVKAPKGELKATPFVPPTAFKDASPPAASGPALDLQLAENYLKQIALAYHSHSDAAKNPPAKMEDLKPYLKDSPGVYESLEKGQIVCYYGVGILSMTQGTSNTILAYERNVPEKGGPVAYADGSVKTITAEQFKAAPKAIK
jgi:hypothetical protein